MLRLSALLMLITTLVVIVGCDEAPSPSDVSTPAQESRRHVIFFNRNADKQTVLVAKDVDALLAMRKAAYQALHDPSGGSAALAQVKALEVDGRLIELSSGTRGDVLKEVPLPGSKLGLTVMVVLIKNGPRTGETVVSLSGQVEPDTGQQ